MVTLPVPYSQSALSPKPSKRHLPGCPLGTLRPSSLSISRNTSNAQRVLSGRSILSLRSVCRAAAAAQEDKVETQCSLVKSHINSICKLAAYSLAFLAWLKLSAGRPGTPFCSSTAASTTSPGLRSVGSSAWAGLAAGCLHSLSGPDHLAALTPLTLGISSVKASLLGAWWGFGHCIGQLILGLLMLLLKDRFHSLVPMMDKYSALTIGLTLITIGGLGLYETLAESPSHVEAAQELPPTIQTAGAGASFPVEPAGTSVTELREVSGVEPPEKEGKGFSIWTLATGVVYGLQPDALFVVIPALALPTKLAAAAYMAMFVMGTVMAMGSYTAFIGATSKAIRKRGTWFRVESLSSIASLIALLMGVAVIFGWSYSIPFLGGANAH